jgi:RimJ/RimL family protein N-acetyltransferase
MGKTVFFRAFEEEDAQLIHKWKNDDELNALTVGLNKRTCFDDDLDWVKSHMRHNPYSSFWAICSKDNNKMIGWTCLTNIHYINSSAEAGAIVIGDTDYRDGFAWVETYLFLYEYAFERLGLNRVYGESILGHKTSNFAEELMFMNREGVLRQAVFKNGHFFDLSIAAILKDDYFKHKEAGEFNMLSVIKRLRKFRKQ